MKHVSALLDQSLLDDMTVETTPISTPPDNMPLNTVQVGKVLMMLLKSSQAASSSSLFSFWAPEYEKQKCIEAPGCSDVIMSGKELWI